MVTIGVTGHRFLAQLDKVTEGVDAALDGVERAFDPPFALTSSLAEGADRLVVRRALARWADACLIVPLPLPEAEYLRDFTSKASREEFRHLLARADEVVPPPSAPSRDEAYAAAGRSVLDRSDVLVAVWDGQGAQGTGGTGEIVAEARASGLPLAWVHAGNRKPGTQEPTTLGEEQGKLTLERFPAPGSRRS